MPLKTDASTSSLRAPELLLLSNFYNKQEQFLSLRTLNTPTPAPAPGNGVLVWPSQGVHSTPATTVAPVTTQRETAHGGRASGRRAGCGSKERQEALTSSAAGRPAARAHTRRRCASCGGHSPVAASFSKAPKSICSPCPQPPPTHLTPSNSAAP